MPAPKKYKGAQIVTMRMEKELIDAVDRICQATAMTRFDGQLSRTDFIVAAIREKIAHRERSKKSSKKRKALPIALGPAGDQVEQLDHVGELGHSLTLPTEVQL